QGHAGEAPGARDRAGGLGHASQDHAVAPEGQTDAESVRRTRSSPRGPAASTAGRGGRAGGRWGGDAGGGGGPMSSGITPELRWGRGVTGQAGALRLAIARALCLADEQHRKKLREQGLLTRDPRVVERKKPGRAGARKRFQFSKR